MPARDCLQRADEAIYARRNTAVELERRIKENELNTEIAVEEKRRTVRETKMRADIAVEQERAELVERRVENQRKESQAQADGLRAMLEPMKDIDWRTLMAAQSGGLDSRQLIAMAFRDLADKAEQHRQSEHLARSAHVAFGAGKADGEAAAGDDERGDQSRGKRKR